MSVIGTTSTRTALMSDPTQPPGKWATPARDTAIRHGFEIDADWPDIIAVMIDLPGEPLPGIKALTWYSYHRLKLRRSAEYKSRVRVNAAMKGNRRKDDLDVQRRDRLAAMVARDKREEISARLSLPHLAPPPPRVVREKRVVTEIVPGKTVPFSMLDGRVRYWNSSPRSPPHTSAPGSS
jgi:hypothetical protein